MRDDVAYVCRHSLHLLVDELVQELVHSRPQSPKHFILNFLKRKEQSPAQGSPSSPPPTKPTDSNTPSEKAARFEMSSQTSTEATERSGDFTRQAARQRSVTMLKSRAANVPPRMAQPDGGGVMSEPDSTTTTRSGSNLGMSKGASVTEAQQEPAQDPLIETVTEDSLNRTLEQTNRPRPTFAVSENDDIQPLPTRRSMRLRRMSSVRSRGSCSQSPKRESVDPSEEDEDAESETGKYACLCTEDELLEGVSEKVKSPSEVDFHTLFHCCKQCQRRPASFISANTLEGFCREHAKEMYDATKEDAVPLKLWINYDLSVYERCFYCYRCEKFTAEYTESLDDFIGALCDSKGTYVREPIRDKHVDVFDFKADFITGAVGVSMQGWRSTQEDAHAGTLTENGKLAIFSVFDGHGGTFVSKWISEHLHQHYEQNAPPLPLTASGGIDDFRKGAQKALIDVDRELELEHGIECGTVGTTCNTVFVTAEDIICINLGDCRAVLQRAGEVVPLSTDHTLSSDVEAERIREAGYEIRNNRIEGMLSVPRALGDFDFKQCGGKPPEDQAVSLRVDMTHVTRKDSDEFVLVACDGVWDGMTSEEAAALLRDLLKTMSPKEALCELLDRNLAPGIEEEGVGTDNQSCILITLK